MVQNVISVTNTETSPGTFYDQIAKLYNLTFKFNGYERSLVHYLRDNPLPLFPHARILDAGCGTGLLTLALMKAVNVPVRITALDLSASSLETAREAVRENGFRHKSKVWFMQGNVLALPFQDNSFDLIVTSGALEYVPLRDGFSELARVLVPGGHLLHLPVRPSLISKLLEVMFRFKAHPPQEIDRSSSRYFRVVNHYRFPPLHPIGWSKSAVLAQRV